MKEITVKIPEEHFKFFNELIDQLGYVEKVYEPKKKPTEKEKILKGIERGLKQVKLVKEGKLKSKPFKDFLNEL